LLADADHQSSSAQSAGAVLIPRPGRRSNQLPVFPRSPRRTGSNAGPTPASGSASSTASATWRIGGPCRDIGRREHLDTILPAVAGLVSSQERALRPDRLRRPPKALLAGTVRWAKPVLTRSTTVCR